MAKLTANQIGLHLDEHNKLEYELSGDEQCRDMMEDSYDDYVEWAHDDQCDDDNWFDDDFDPYYDPYPMVGDWWED